MAENLLDTKAMQRVRNGACKGFADAFEAHAKLLHESNGARVEFRIGFANEDGELNGEYVPEIILVVRVPKEKDCG